VQPGDHLWRIAERTLAAAWGREPTDAEIDPYWRDLIDLNRKRLRDAANPDRIFPGQVFELPPVPAPPR
jgi:nucleoid-associated protein YgaU